ncbi:MAG TPA: hypothetical protein PLY23_09285 [Alphaproteobacteria bacterium]|nr:hypothetical protein [Alphaproteobacteria bacterium]HQS94800.1 hypothetical protein [Alphaproteobacteria bacterium]
MLPRGHYNFPVHKQAAKATYFAGGTWEVCKSPPQEDSRSQERPMDLQV